MLRQLDRRLGAELALQSAVRAGLPDSSFSRSASESQIEERKEPGWRGGNLGSRHLLYVSPWRQQLGLRDSHEENVTKLAQKFLLELFGTCWSRNQNLLFRLLPFNFHAVMIIAERHLLNLG